MNRKLLLWLSAAAVLAVLVAYQTLGSLAKRSRSGNGQL